MGVDTVHYAFGVTFRFTFPVPELGASVSDDRPDCEVVLGGPEEALELFSGGTGDERDTARADLGDGQVSLIERGRHGDHLLRYGDRGLLHITKEVDRVLCSTTDPESPSWRRYLFDTGLGSVSLLRGFEALHAGAVLFGSGVVAIVGEQGSGKSTLVAELMRQGRPLFTDDILAMSPGRSAVVAHAGPPLVNLAPVMPDGTPSDALGRTLASIDGEQWLQVSRPAVTSSIVTAVVLLDRGAHAELAIDELPASPTPLLPHTLRSGRAPSRMEARLDLCSDLATTASLLRVRAPEGMPPAAVAETVLDTIPHAALGGRDE